MPVNASASTGLWRAVCGTPEVGVGVHMGRWAARRPAVLRSGPVRGCRLRTGWCLVVGKTSAADCPRPDLLWEAGVKAPRWALREDTQLLLQTLTPGTAVLRPKRAGADIEAMLMDERPSIVIAEGG